MGLETENNIDSNNTIICNYDKDKKCITSEVWVVQGDEKYPSTALWDTGASKTSVSLKLLELMGIRSGNPITHRTIKGEYSTFKTTVDIMIPGISPYTAVEVVAHDPRFTDIGCTFSVVIGYDIISRGEFIIENIREEVFCSYKRLI